MPRLLRQVGTRGEYLFEKIGLAEESPLFTGAEAPRTWRIALRGQR